MLSNMYVCKWGGENLLNTREGLLSATQSLPAHYMLWWIHSISASAFGTNTLLLSNVHTYIHTYVLAIRRLRVGESAHIQSLQLCCVSFTHLLACWFVCVVVRTRYLHTQMFYFELGRRHNKSNAKTNKQLGAKNTHDHTYIHTYWHLYILIWIYVGMGEYAAFFSCWNRKALKSWIANKRLLALRNYQRH